MEATFQLNADELGLPLLERIRSLFPHERIRISVVNEPASGTASTITVRELPAFFDSLPPLSMEEAAAFARDIEEIRRTANAIPLRDPWAS